MHDIARLQKFQHVGELIGDSKKLDAMEWLAIEFRRQRFSFHDFHHHRQHVAGGDDVVDRNEKGVIERSAEADVADHLIAPRRIARKLARQNLDRDGFRKLRVFRFPDRVADALDETIVQQLVARGQRLDRGHAVIIRTVAVPASPE